MAKGTKADGLVVVAIVVVALWLMSAAASGRRDARLVPNWIEGPIDDAVARLNRVFGKRWVGHGIRAIQRALLGTLPPGLAPMAVALFEVERMGNAAGWSGQQKKQAVASRMT